MRNIAGVSLNVASLPVSKVLPPPQHTGAEVGGDDWRYLRRKHPRTISQSSNSIRIADIFSGCGGLSLGVSEACQDLGFRPAHSLAIDIDDRAVSVFKHNFKDAFAITDSVANIFHNDFDSRITSREKEIAQKSGRIDFLIGGPPCQGHSDLNNYSRRNDPKNSLYLFMARAARVLKPKNVIIENVVGAAHDVSGVVEKASRYLEEMGYQVEVGILNAIRFGIPQSRKRLILVASFSELPKIGEIEEKYAVQPRDLRWAIGDLSDISGDSPFDCPSRPSPDNMKRIEFLFENKLFDLPNSERPKCHRDKSHTYNSVYGRLSWDKPAQTITSGFYSMCMGRYVHPSKRRTLTAHEAARIQFFPDSFSFSPVSQRSHLATIIGNAVPMKIPYVIAKEILRRME